FTGGYGEFDSHALPPLLPRELPGVHILLLRSVAPLREWEPRPIWRATAAGQGPGDHRDAYERELAVEPPGGPLPDGPYRRVAGAILGYRLFPPSLVTGELRRSPLQAGDTVGIRYHGPLGIDLFFAARVVDR